MLSLPILIRWHIMAELRFAFAPFSHSHGICIRLCLAYASCLAFSHSFAAHCFRFVMISRRAHKHQQPKKQCYGKALQPRSQRARATKRHCSVLGLLCIAREYILLFCAMRSFLRFLFTMLVCAKCGSPFFDVALSSFSPAFPHFRFTHIQTQLVSNVMLKEEICK